MSGVRGEGGVGVEEKGVHNEKMETGGGQLRYGNIISRSQIS